MLYTQLERLVRGLAFYVIALAVSSPLYAHAETVTVCHSPRAIGGWFGTADRLTNEIRMITDVRTATDEQVGWFYRLQDRRIFFQPAITYGIRFKGRNRTPFVELNDRTGGPVVLVKSETTASVARAVREMIAKLHVEWSTVPQPFRDVAADKVDLVIRKCR